MSEILPCPFCGWHEQHRVIIVHRNLRDDDLWAVKCCSGACGAFGPKATSRGAAIIAWNKATYRVTEQIADLVRRGGDDVNYWRQRTSDVVDGLKLWMVGWRDSLTPEARAQLDAMIVHYETKKEGPHTPLSS